MSKSESRQRPHVVAVRLDDREHAILVARADERGLSKSDYTRALVVAEKPIGVMARHRRPTGSEVEIAALLKGVLGLTAELNKIGSNVNQLAHNSNAGYAVPAGEVAAAAEALSLFHAMAADLREAALAALRVRKSDDGEDSPS